MSFQYFLLNISPGLLLFFIILLFTTINIITTYLFRRYVIINKNSALNETMSEFFNLLGGIYGLLLGFVVLLVYNSFNGAQAKANQEQSLARSLYWEIRYFPNKKETAPLMDAYLKYVHSVVEEEYPQMEKLQPFNKSNRQYINAVYREMEKFYAVDNGAEAMISHLNEMDMYRGLRQLDASSDIPLVIWLPLMLGYLIILVFSFFIGIASSRMHLFVSGMLGAFIGLVIYIIITLNHPFSGSLKVVPEVYQTILQMQG